MGHTEPHWHPVVLCALARGPAATRQDRAHAAVAGKHQSSCARRWGAVACGRHCQADGEGMMRALRFLLAGALAASLAGPALAQEEAPTPPPQHWSFDGIFGTYDLAAAQRGFQVYSEVCAVCHTMNYLHYRDLTGIGLTPDQIKAIAAAVTVPQGLDDEGNVKTGPGTPADQFVNPYPLYDPTLNIVRTKDRKSTRLNS